MARSKERSFGQVLRERRRQLDLTQEELARRIKTSTPYIGHLESGKRHPSDKIVIRLSEVLGLDRRELFFLANARTRAVYSTAPPDYQCLACGKTLWLGVVVGRVVLLMREESAWCRPRSATRDLGSRRLPKTDPVGIICPVCGSNEVVSFCTMVLPAKD